MLALLALAAQEGPVFGQHSLATLPTNVPATSVALSAPQGVAADGHGNVFFLDGGAIYRVDSAGMLTLFAGNGTVGFSGDGGPAVNAQMDPWQIAADADGNVYVADWGNNRVRKISGGIITTVAGDGQSLRGAIPAAPPGDNGPATSATISDPIAVTVGPDGAVFVAHSSFISRISGGIASRVAGCGTCSTGGLVTSNGPATNTDLGSVQGLVADAAGNVFYSIYGGCEYFAEGTIVTAGSISSGCVTVNSPENRVKKLANGLISNFAGNGTKGYLGDGGSAANAEFGGVGQVALDSGGNLYVADLGNGRIRKISPAGTITTVAGSGSFGFAGDQGPATAAQFANPGSRVYGIAVDPAGALYVADVNNQRIRKISGGTITTVAGGGTVPAIKAGGVVPVGGTVSRIAPGSWVSIYGSGFTDKEYTAPTLGETLPTLLGGVRASINGKPAFLSYVSPTQINLQAPDDTIAGTVPVVVTNRGYSTTATVTLAPISPSFSLFGDGKHPAGVILTPNGDGAYGGGTYDLAGPTGAFGFSTRSVRPGEVLVLFGVGFGPTTPRIPAGQVFSGSAITDFPVSVTIGEVPATVLYSGITSTGLYQFNVVVPNVGGGDQTLVARVNGASSQAGVVVAVKP